MKYFTVYIFLFISIFLSQLSAQEKDRWSLFGNDGIVWNIDSGTAHSDHIEMSGEQLSVVLRYGVDQNRAFVLNRSIVWPMLRFFPNETHDHLNKRFALNVSELILIDNKTLGPEIVDRVIFDGIMTVESRFANENLHLTRSLYPSTKTPFYFEKYAWENTGNKSVKIDLPNVAIDYVTDPKDGIYGKYTVKVVADGHGSYLLEPGERRIYYVKFSAGKADDLLPNTDAEKELSDRKLLVNEWWSELRLETPDSILNAMFDFAKLRASESIYRTKGGLMHGPGGESYYAAIWANDQAEYVNPFFPFLGYRTGNESALNSFRHFARFMNDEYKPIPSSIISEGDNIWAGAGDRGDAAMIAYGAARYALARGDKKEAEELWPLIEWCLEFCKRKINSAGVVASDRDELEGRFPAGDANLCTSGLYYDALISTVYLGKDLKKSESQLNEYKKEAHILKNAIEDHFGYNVEGFETYRYYDGNDILRSWICIPLTVGIFDRSEATVNALFSPRLWTDDGLLTQAGTETFWDRSTLYALRGVFAAGAKEKGVDFLKKYSRRRLLGDHVPYAIEAWPEGSQRHLSAESGLYCRIFTEGIFGIRPTGLRSFEMTPQLPDEWDHMNLKSVHAFGQVFDIDVIRKKATIEVCVRLKDKIVLKKQIRSGEKISVRFN